MTSRYKTISKNGNSSRTKLTSSISSKPGCKCSHTSLPRRLNLYESVTHLSTRNNVGMSSSPHKEFPLCCNINQKDDKNRNVSLHRQSTSQQNINVARKQLGKLSTSLTDTDLMCAQQQSKAKDIGILCPQTSVNKLNLMTNEKILIFGGIDPYCPKQIDVDCKDVLYYDIVENIWKNLSVMPGSKHHHSVAVIKNKVYVIGGTRIGGRKSSRPILSSAVWCFDPHRFEWSVGTSLPHPRRDFAIIADGEGFYVIGGEGCEGEILSSTLYYNVNEEKWYHKGSLNIGRTGLAAVLVDKEIWIAGGMIGSTHDHSSVITDTMEAYNFKKNIWTKVGHLRIPRAFGQLCMANNNELFIIGGIGLSQDMEFLSLSTIDKYSFWCKEWKPVTQLMTPRHSHTVITIENYIFVFGGVSTQKDSSLSSIECLSTETMEWIQGISPMPKPLSGLAAAKIL